MDTICKTDQDCGGSHDGRLCDSPYRPSRTGNSQLAVNIPVFFIPMILGCNQEEVSTWWKRQPWYKVADASVVLAENLLLIAFPLFGEPGLWEEIFGNFAI